MCRADGQRADRRHFDFVEMDARVVGVHADRGGVADEMDIVAARGELHAEFGGDDARAAVSGVTGYADAHGVCFRVSVELVRAVTIQQFRFWLTATSRKRKTGLKTRHYMPG